MAQPFTMPSRRHHSAPTFDGTLADLPLFFRDFEDLANPATLTNEGKIDYAMRYVSSECGELWGATQESTGDDWVAFKNAVMRFYPCTD
jgi:hypothetical protein